MLPPGGSIRGRLTLDLPLGCLEGGDFFDDNLLVRIHFFIVMIGWTGLQPFGLKGLFFRWPYIYLPSPEVAPLWLPKSKF